MKEQGKKIQLVALKKFLHKNVQLLKTILCLPAEYKMKIKAPLLLLLLRNPMIIISFYGSIIVVLLCLYTNCCAMSSWSDPS